MKTLTNLSHHGDSIIKFAKRNFLYSFLLLAFISNSFQTSAQVQTPKLLSIDLPFNIDGYLVRQNDSFGDWLDTTAYTSGVNNGAVVDYNSSTGVISSPFDLTFHVNDSINVGTKNTDDVFDGGNKWNDNPNNWGWKIGNTPNKDDINRVNLHIAEDIHGDIWAMVSGDRYTTNGTSYIDFEFLQERLTPKTVGSSSFFDSDGTDCGRTDGDLLVTVEYTNGGSVDSIYFYRWSDSASTSCGWDWKQFWIPSGAPDLAYGFVNSTNIPVPYGAYGSLTYTNLQFVEVAINLSSLIGEAVEEDPCFGLLFKTMFMKTKSSNSYTADLKDMIWPFQLNLNVGIGTLVYEIPDCHPAGVYEDSLLGPGTVKGGSYWITHNGDTSTSVAGASVGDSTGTLTIDDTASGFYTVWYQYSPRKNCVKDTFFTFFVNRVDAGTPVENQMICSGDTPDELSLEGNYATGTASYQWQSSTTGCNGTYSDINGATDSTYQPGAISDYTWYRVILTSTTDSSTCSDTSSCVVIGVNEIDFTQQPSSQATCDLSNYTDICATVSTSGDVSYQWQMSSTGCGSGFSDISGATDSCVTPAAVASVRYYRLIATSVMKDSSGSVVSTCYDTSNCVSVQVNDVTAGTASAPQTLCENSDPAALTLSGTSGDGTLGYQWEYSDNNSTWNTIVGATSSSYDPPSGLMNDRWYRAVVSSTLSGFMCKDTSTVVKITINNMDPGEISGNQVICEGDNPVAFTNTTSATGDGTITYQWEYSDDNSTWTSIVGATSTTYDAGALTQDRYYRRWASSLLAGVQCDQLSNVLKVSVNNMDPGVIAGNQVICEGDDPAAFTNTTSATGDGTITYQWQYSDDNSTWNAIAGATSATYDAGPLTQDRWYRRLATSTLTENGNTKACTEISNVLKVTVNNMDPGVIAGNQVICEGDDPAAFTNTTSATGDGTITYQWQYSDDNSTWNAIAGATSATYDAGPLTQDRWYRRLATSTLTENGNTKACTEISNVLKVTVNNMDPGVIAGNQVICEGDDPAAFTNTTSATGDGTITYQWQYSDDNSTWNAIAGATSATYDAGPLTQDRWYRRLATSTLTENGNTKACTEISNVLKVTVNNMDPGVIAGNQVICEGDDPAAFTNTTSATGDGTITYQWQYSDDNSTWNAIAGATSATYDAGPLTQDRWYRRLATSTLTENGNTKACTEISNVLKVTVNNMDPGVIAGNQVICEGDDPAAFTNTTSATGDGTITYQWQYSDDNSTWNAIAGATSATYDAGPLTQDRWYRRLATSTLTENGNTKACTEISNVLKVTVNNMDPGVIAGNQVICEGDDPAAFTNTTSATGDGTITYQWQYSDDNSTWNAIAGATSATYDAGPLTQDRWYRRLATSTLTENGNTKACTEISNVLKVTVNNMDPGVIAGNQVICEGDDPAAFTNTTSATGDGTITYQWQYSDDNSTWNAIAGATSATYDAGPLTQDRWYRRLATSTLTENGNTKACTEISNVLKVTVNNMDPGVIAGNQVICEGDDPAAFTNTTSATGDGTITYQWQYSDDNSTWNAIAGATSATYDAGPLTQDRWYRRLATSTLTENGNTKACTEISNVLKVTVNNMDPGVIAGNQVICEGDDPAAFTNTTSATGDGTITYQWQYSDDNSTWNAIAGATSATYDAGPLTQDRWYRRLATSTLTENGNTKACTEISNVLKVTVNNMDPGVIAGNQVICEGDDPAAFTNTTSATGDGTITYQWQYSDDNSTWNAIAGATSATYDAGPLTQDRWYRRLATSTLTENGNTKACTEISNVLKVTVNNMDPGVIAGNQVICEGDDPAAFTNTTSATGDGTITYQWQYSDDNSTWNAIAGATSATYDAGPLTQDRWYRRLATSTLTENGNTKACTEISNVLKVTVNNMDPGVIAGNQVICEGDDPAAFTNTTSATGDGTITYQWQYSDDNSTWNAIAGATSATYDAGPLTQDRWYRRLATSTLTENGNTKACTEISNDLLIKVNNLDPGNANGADSVCSGDTPNEISAENVVADGVISYQWQEGINGPNGDFKDIIGATSATYQPGALTDTTWFRAEITSTLDFKDCVEAGTPVEIVVWPLPEVEFEVTDSICADDAPFEITGGTPVGGDYSGTGVINNWFYPSSDLIGNHNITYTYTDGNGCVNSDSDTFKVRGCAVPYCAQSQGYWGNFNGVPCYFDSTYFDTLNPPNTFELLQYLLDDDLVIGDLSNCTDKYRSLRITDADVYNLLAVMPAGGPSKPFFSHKGKCSDPTDLTSYFNTSGKIVPSVSRMHKDGRFKNTLIGQTIAVMLSVRNNSTLGDAIITGDVLVTVAGDCVGDEMMSPDTTRRFTYMPTSILDYFGTSYTVQDLLDLANNALSGAYVPSGANPTYTELTKALDGIIDAFHDCRLLVDQNMSKNKFSQRWFDGEGDDPSDGMQELANLDMMVHPNPFTGELTFNIYVPEDGDYRYTIYNALGKTIYDVEIELRAGLNTFDFSTIPAKKVFKGTDLLQLADGMYFIIVQGNDTSVIEKAIKTAEN